MEEEKNEGGILKHRLLAAFLQQETRKRMRKTVASLLLLVLWVGGLLYLTAEKFAVEVKVSDAAEAQTAEGEGRALDFGTLRPGAYTSRFFRLGTDGSHSYHIRVLTFGSIAKVSRIDNADFVLYGGSDVKVEMVVEVPETNAEQEYEGTVLALKIPRLF